MSRGENRIAILDQSRIHGLNKNTQTGDFGNLFSKTASSTEPLASEVGVGEANHQELISFFLGILPSTQVAAVSSLVGPEPRGPHGVANRDRDVHRPVPPSALIRRNELYLSCTHQASSNVPTPPS